MDKKKVKELIEQIADTLNWHITAATESSFNAKVEVLKQLEEVKSEIQKSDWISVEDGLPEYGENVWVRSLINPDSVWCTRRTTLEKDARDSNDFINIGHCSITHWKPIEKLEE